MARLNIEDSLLKDNRFTKLCIKVGSRRAALGAVVEAWLIAQEYWKFGTDGVPRSVWIREELSMDLVEVGLAYDKGDFIYVSGSEKHFSWIRQKVEAGKSGGIKSGKARADIIEKKSKRNEAQSSAANPLTLTLPLSLTLTQALTQKEKKADSVPSELYAAITGLESLQSLFVERQVQSKVQAKILDAFPDPQWVIGEIKKAIAWETANPNRKKKNFAAFITRWLTSGWDRRKVEPLSGRSLKEQLEGIV